MMSFNLRYAAANDPYPWETRREIVQEIIQEQQPDVIGTQEGLHRQIADLDEALPEYEWIGVGREGGQLGEYMAVFYNPQRLKPLEHSHFWLSDTPEIISSTTWGNRIPRMVTWVRFQDLQTNKTFYFLNTHLDHQSEISRQASAELILQRLSSFDPDIPVVITGDFNASPSSLTYSIFGEGGLQDGMLSAKKTVNAELRTYHNYGDPTGGGANRRIDWILHSDQVNVLHAEIITYNRDGQYPSDHFPVMIEAILKKSSKTAENTVEKPPIRTALHITEVVPNSHERGNYNYVELYNPGSEPIDLEGYQIYYYYDPQLPFDKSKSNRWTITKDSYSTNTVIGPQETKVIWIKKQPCCYELGMEQFLANYSITADELGPDQLLAVFTPGDNQGLNGTSTTGRSLGLVSPDGAHLVGVQYNDGSLDVHTNQAITYTEPEALSSIMQKSGSHQQPSPGTP
ncbi:endonuclease/exonuclease/phosphatase family protein [Paenibacillus senegalensis]|uniref:endonuclease/exonuclease/phosphatase family protein n=1 Tax=Paenibacillus senegalensis TaxID=1465766 RepID=UPI000289B270|nr:endonuclease/exonuclease/phosphatase family protein [Paenibacillus senegalensis]